MQVFSLSAQEVSSVRMKFHAIFTEYFSQPQKLSIQRSIGENGLVVVEKKKLRPMRNFKTFCEFSVISIHWISYVGHISQDFPLFNIAVQGKSYH